MSFLPADKETAYYKLIAKIESNNNPLAKNPLSTASGLYQPIKSTWTAYGFAWSDVFNVAKQEQFIRRFTADNARILNDAGCAINFATLYGAHFLGAQGLLRAMRGKPADSISTVTSAAQRKANPTILKGTIKDFCDWLERKTGDSVYKRYTDKPVKIEAPISAPKGNTVMNWLNGLVGKTAIQYILAAIGGFLVSTGKLDAGQWETIAGAVLVLVGLIPGAVAAATEKLMVGGKVVKIADLPPSTQALLAKEAGAK